MVGATSEQEGKKESQERRRGCMSTGKGAGTPKTPQPDLPYGYFT